MSCICIDELRPASFRGASFYVASDKGEYGRRDIIHEYPMRDDPYIEDMGQKASKFSVSGYLFGDNWVSLKDALVSACTARGPAMLQLPTESPILVNCLTLAVSRSKDECGYYAVQIEFVAAKNSGFGGSAIGAIESQIGAVFNSAIAPLTTYFDNNFVSKDVLSYVTNNSFSRVAAFATDVIAAVESAPSNDRDLTTNVAQTAISVFQNAVDYAQPGSDAAIYLADQPIVAETIGRVANDTGVLATVSETGVTVTSGSAAIVPLIAYTVNGIGNSMAVDDAIVALTNLATWSVSETRLTDLRAQLAIVSTSAVVSTSDTADAINGTAFCGVVRSFALMKLAQAIAAKNFRNRTDAIQARANVVELFNAQIELFEEDEIVNILLNARNLAVTAITKKMATLVPVLTITANVSKPSLYWASRLYDDVYRAEELADRNDVSAPAFMPPTFEALAR